MGQFGTDLSMIQQLFPGRTRRQVKLKYKKEERQHPSKLRDALTSRPTGRFSFILLFIYYSCIYSQPNELNIRLFFLMKD